MRHNAVSVFFLTLNNFFRVYLKNLVQGDNAPPI